MGTIINNYKTSDIAHSLNISTRRVQQLVKIGILPTPVKGKYDLACCIRKYEQYLQEKLVQKNQGQSTSSYGNVVTQKLRLLKAQADKAEFEVEILTGKYLLATEVELLWSGLIIAFRSRMLNIPTNLARQLMTVSNDFMAMVNILSQEIEQALLELSNYQHEPAAESSSTESTSDNQSDSEASSSAT